MSLLPLLVGCEGHPHIAHPHPSLRRAYVPQRYHWPSRLAEQDFGLPIMPDDILTNIAHPLQTEDYYRPWRHRGLYDREIGSNIKTDKTKMTINLDVQHFTPDELNVKTVGNFVVVEGRHEEKKDEHGYITRRFVRRYQLPEGVAPENVESRLSSDGVLTIIAPRKTPEAATGERKVQITQTGPIRKEIKLEGNIPRPDNYNSTYVPTPGQHFHLVQGVTGVNPVPPAEAAPATPAAEPAAEEATEGAPPPAEAEEEQK
ncbi:protein lethal(2)essential for life-like [Trichoplusia ni]|uniref:Protein lethal(2)essential for life-like n=1 Tax=Trichoplusia ni TaxID=7111 RepID=A0A7E5W017_TRINI|nr:protein lethal(2)essential for life-like [Trichoplusia ni]